MSPDATQFDASLGDTLADGPIPFGPFSHAGRVFSVVLGFTVTVYLGGGGYRCIFWKVGSPCRRASRMRAVRWTHVFLTSESIACADCASMEIHRRTLPRVSGMSLESVWVSVEFMPLVINRTNRIVNIGIE